MINLITMQPMVNKHDKRKTSAMVVQRMGSAIKKDEDIRVKCDTGDRLVTMTDMQDET